MDNLDQGFPEEAARAAVGGTQAIARATALLREIAASSSGSSALVDLAARAGLERPTAYRILRRLVVEGLVEQDPASRGYALGPLLYELGLAARPPQQLNGLASAAITRLAKESGDTVFAIIRSGMDSLCLDRQEGVYPVKALMMSPGRRRPMGIGSGSLALLSAMPEAAALQVLETNAQRIRAAGESDVSALHQAVAEGRAQGYVVRAAAEAPEILSLAVAVRNAYGTPVLALSISALKFRVEHRLDYLVSLLQDASAAVELGMRQLGAATLMAAASSGATAPRP